MELINHRDSRRFLTKNENSPAFKTPYTIQTKKLPYKLTHQDAKFNWLQNCSWNNETSDASAYILRNVDCEARPGEIMAIAGPSGAGKTTLIEILAGMVPLNRVSGQVLVNEQPMNGRLFRKLSGHVTQDAALFPLLTVEEPLMYSARLRLQGGSQTASGRVEELLKELGLERVANTRIGSESKRGISGGEKRRVSIGVDLVHDPAVLLIDEPTSGLDSASAFHAIFLLKSMALKQGKTIVLTIHQPGFRILEQIDQILLLSNGIVRQQGSLKLLEQRLSFAGHSIPRQINVLEFAVEITECLVIEFGDQSEAESSNCTPDDQDSEKIRNFNVEEIEIFYANNPLNEVLVLAQRFSNTVMRTTQMFSSRLLLSMLFGIVLGSIFVDAKTHKEQTQIGFFAYNLSFLLSSTTEVLPIFLQERRIVMRETSKGAYRVASYVISNTLVFLPFLFLVAVLYSTPLYWLVGLRREIDGFLYFLLLVWLVVLMSNSFGACISALVPNFILGTSVIACLMGAFFLFSGYFTDKEDIPCYWIFMYYLSLFKYPLECSTINEFGGAKGKTMCGNG